MTTYNIPMTGCNVPVTSCNVPVTGSNVPMTSSNVPMTSYNVPVTGSNVPMTSSNEPMTGCNVTQNPLDASTPATTYLLHYLQQVDNCIQNERLEANSLKYFLSFHWYVIQIKYLCHAPN